MKRLIIGIVIIAVIILAWIGARSFFGTESSNQASSTPSNLFPPAPNTPGQGTGASGSTNPETGGGQATSNPESGGLFKQIAAGPVVGVGISSTGTTTKVRYIEKQTGHIYEYGEESTETRRLTNTTIPRVESGKWSGEKNVLITYLDEETGGPRFFAATLVATTSKAFPEPYLLDGYFLPETTLTTAVSGATGGAKPQLFYISKGTSGAKGVITDFIGKTKKEIFTSPFFSWRGSFGEGPALYISEKPSSRSESSLYRIDTTKPSASDSNLVKVFGGQFGLLVLPDPTGHYIIYSTAGSGGIKTYVYDRKLQLTSDFPITTLADKCSWLAAGESLVCAVPESPSSRSYPDDWFMGLVSFSDSFWGVDLAGGTVSYIAQAGTERAFDAIEVTPSPSGKFLYFIDKKTLSLWQLSLTSEGVLH